jgi:aryl-alcohol dehydrogenase-like predicted oxidoreductase
MNSKLILGTVQLGVDYGINNISGKPTEEKAFSILDYAFKNGIEILDTADVYGTAQTVIGNYHLTSGNIFKVNSKFKGNSLPIKIQITKILSELNIESLNVLFYHDFNDFINFPNLLPELVDLKQEGKFSKIGLSVYDNLEFESAVNNPSIDVIQLPFNLFDNINERGKLIKIAKENNKIVQIRSVFLQGLFFRDPLSLNGKLNPLAKYLAKINEIAKNHNLTIEELAFGYALLQTQIDEIIIGVENQSQLIKNIELFAMSFDSSILEEVNKLKIIEKELLYPKNWN